MYQRHPRLRSGRNAKPAFEQKILARVERIRAGDVFDPQNNFGPLVSFPHRDNVLRYIAKGKEEGARVLCGGDVLKGDGFDNGAWLHRPCSPIAATK